MTTQLSHQPTKHKDRNAATQTDARPVTFLRNVLYANAIFSTLCAALFLLDSGPIAIFLGWPLVWPIVIIGVGLLPFALLVYKTARNLPQGKRLVWLIFEMDLLWVVASIVVLLMQWPTSTTTGGRWAIGIVAEIVALFAILEYIGLRRLKEQS